MWMWIILMALAHGNVVLCNPETIGNEYPPDDIPADDSMFFYMDERSSEYPQRSEDIETRRRSALDKNFMRFGRSDMYTPTTHGNEPQDLDYADEFARPERAGHKNDNFIRFGRGRNGDFIRFGRDPFKYMQRVTRGKDKNFIRFGRSLPAKRSRRDVYAADAYDQQYKRINNNNRNMLRFGRNDNFMRFGRIPYQHNDNHDIHDNGSTNQSISNENKEKNSINPLSIYHDSTLFPLLTEIALKMRNENKYNSMSRLG